MLRRVIQWAAAIGVLVVVGYPITREMQARALVEHTMINSLDVNDEAALKQWPGTIESFIVILHERCMSTHYRDGAACAHYSQSGK
jgi:hypothetical protein